MSNRRKANSTSKVKGDRTPSPVMLHTRKIARSLEASCKTFTTRIKRIEAAGERIITGGPTLQSPGSWEIIDWRTEEKLAGGDGGPDEFHATKKRLVKDLPIHDLETIEAECFEEPSETPGIPLSLSDALIHWVASDGTPYEEIAAVAEMSVREVSDYVSGFRSLPAFF